MASTIPAGIVATLTHYGPYTGLPGAHKFIRQWCDDNGHKRAGPNWEIYGHWQQEWNTNPDKIRTDIFYLLA
jgi:effector-binding domain-containing protein